MNTDIAANSLDDSIKLSKINSYCLAITSMSSSQYQIDMAIDILDILNEESK